MESISGTVKTWENDEYNDEDSNFQCCGCIALKCMCVSLVCTCNCKNINCEIKDEDDLLKDETEEMQRKKYIYKKWSINGCQLYYGLSFQNLLTKHLGIN